MTQKIQTSVSETEDTLLRKMSVLEDNLSDLKARHGFLDGQSLNNYSMVSNSCHCSLQCRRILGGRKLLVYVCNVVTAIFDVIAMEDLGQ